MNINKWRRLKFAFQQVLLFVLCSVFLISCTYPIFVRSDGTGQPGSADAQTFSSDDVIETEENEQTSDDQQKKPLCGDYERMTVLVLGIDNHAQADAIRMVSVNFVTGEASVISIPRDFYVSVVGFEDKNIHQGRINATYGYGEKYWGEGSGVSSTSENLAHNFGVEFDRYVVLNFDIVAEFIDVIGGVDIHLEQAEADHTVNFTRGDHHLDGEMAVKFMRMRRYDDDFHRINRQSMIIKVFYSKVMNELEPDQQVQLALMVLSDPNIKTNFIANDIYPLMCLARLIDSEDVNFIEIPKSMYHSATTSSGGAVQIPHDSVAPFIQSVMDGNDQVDDSALIEE